MEDESPLGDLGGGSFGSSAKNGGADVHREIDAGIEGGSRDECHQSHQRLREHRTVPDEPGVTLARDDLRRRAARHQGVEAGHGTARNGNEGERKELSCEYRTAAVDELRDRRHLELRHQHDDGDADTEIVPIFMNAER